MFTHAENSAGSGDVTDDGDVNDDEVPRKSTAKVTKEKGGKKDEIEQENFALQSQGREGPSTTKAQKGEVFTKFKRTLEANQPPTLTYLNELGRLAETANASRLQMLLKKVYSSLHVYGIRLGNNFRLKQAEYRPYSSNQR
eukprot:1405063-Pyramimonas_sp.AAC.2